MATNRTRKKAKTYDHPADSVAGQPSLEGRLNHQSFDLIKDINFDQDSLVLTKFGVPCPVSFLEVETNGRQGQFGLIVNVFSKYTEYLLESIEKCEDSRFSKRRTMFIKLVNAVNLKFICAFRWKYYDRILLKSIDRNRFGLSNNIQKVKEYLQIYQSLWQEHCRSMQRLLGEWNDVNYLMKTFKIDRGEESDISSTIAELNRVVQDVTSAPSSGDAKDATAPDGVDGSNEQEPTGSNPAASKDKVDDEGEGKTSARLTDLLRDVKCDKDYAASINNMKSKISHLKYTRTNQLQLIVNRTIGKYEELLDTLEGYNDTLVKVSNSISEKMFKKMPINDYVKLIQEMPHIQL